MTVGLIFKYFTDLTDDQKHQYRLLEDLYRDWNQKINVVSRKDIDELYLRHVLHSLGIAKVIEFEDGARVLDVGTGGGFPGIPLAIMFPDVEFILVDSIGKKVRVVEDVVKGLNLKIVMVLNCRAEELTGKYDYVVSRAVAAMPTFVRWVKDIVRQGSVKKDQNGIYYLKGGDLGEELADYPKAFVYNLRDFFEEPFFETKKVVFLPHSQM